MPRCHPQPLLSLLVPLSAIGLSMVLAAGCGDVATRRVPNWVDLHPHASSGTDAGQKGRVKLMAETKTHRIAFVSAGAELSFTDLNLPESLRFEAEILLLDLPSKSRKPLIAELVAIDEGGRETLGQIGVRTQLENGQRWIPVVIELTAPDPIRELRLRFRRDDFASRPGGRLAVLRPRVLIESEIPIRSRAHPRQMVLITTDTLRADVLGCYGNTEVKTPAIDRLAEESTLFERAYAAANVTNPSHTSMFTSLYLKDHGVDDNFTKLAPEVPTMLEPLRAAGFRTAAFVSSFNFQPEKSDFDQRFDDFFPCQIYFERRAEDVNLDAFPWFVEHADEDFFVWLHYFDAHMPYVPPAPFNRMYTAESEGKIELPIDYRGNLNWFAGTRAAGHYRAMYQGEVSYLDHQLGLLFEQLRAVGIYDGATIALISDHGESLGEHGVYCDHASLFDEVTRVPFLIKQPTYMQPGQARRIAALVSGIDLYPTLFDLYGLKVPNEIRGVSLLPWMRGGAGTVVSEAYSTFARGAQESLRTEGHRFLIGVRDEELFPNFAIEAGKVELFEVPANGELREITDAEPDRLESLARRMEEFLSEGFDYSAIPIDEAFLDSMGDLGYTQSERDSKSD